MIKKNQRLLNAINMITDAVIVLLAYLFASWFWLQVFQKDLTNIARLNLFWSGAFWASIVYAASMALILAMLGIYRSSRVRGLKKESFIIVEANILYPGRRRRVISVSSARVFTRRSVHILHREHWRALRKTAADALYSARYAAQGL